LPDNEITRTMITTVRNFRRYILLPLNPKLKRVDGRQMVASCQCSTNRQLSFHFIHERIEIQPGPFPDCLTNAPCDKS
jgi:hypothetical protein